jgi:thiosulfate/3-mercaptopyruvate sulfurtransferase
MKLLLALSLLAPSPEYARPDLLVETAWLEEHLEDPNVRVVDTRTSGYEEGHVPGAVWLDIDASRDAANPPTYLPDLDRFVETLEELGISSETRVVFYDDRGGIYGTRPWVLLRMLDHENAAILDGGWSKWTAEARPVTAEQPRVPRGSFEARTDPRWIATADDVYAAIGRSGSLILDSRTEEELAGRDLRGNPRGGAVPGARPLYWEETLEGAHQTFRPASELAELFEAAGVGRDDAIITYCQGGGRAAHELFVLYLMGYEDVRLYLGSWEDWSRREDLPVEKK